VSYLCSRRYNVWLGRYFKDRRLRKRGEEKEWKERQGICVSGEVQSAKCLNLVNDKNAYSQAWSCRANRNSLNTRKGTGQHVISQSINIPPLMDSEGSLPCSQKPATGSYPEPEEFDPRTHFRLRLSIYIFFFSGFLIKILYAFLIQLIGLVGKQILCFLMCSR